MGHAILLYVTCLIKFYVSLMCFHSQFALRVLGVQIVGDFAYVASMGIVIT